METESFHIELNALTWLPTARDSAGWNRRRTRFVLLGSDFSIGEHDCGFSLFAMKHASFGFSLFLFCQTMFSQVSTPPGTLHLGTRLRVVDVSLIDNHENVVLPGLIHGD